MKTKILIVILLFTSFMANNLLAQDLSKFSSESRDSILVEIALREYKKEEYKDFYRIYGKPIITKHVIDLAPNIYNPKASTYGAKPGDVAYKVTFLYDKSMEQFEYNYAAIISIWEKTGKVFSIRLGDGYSYNIRE